MKALKRVAVGVSLAVLLASALLWWLYIPHPSVPQGTTIYVIPVYGQSNALGEETSPLTDFDSLRIRFRHRIRTDELDERFGYFDGSIAKQRVKRMIGYNRRSHETSCYALACRFVEWLDTQGDSVSLVCSFEAGQGETGIDGILKGSLAYNKLIAQIENIQGIASKNGCRVAVPAFCWVHGENDIVWNTGNDYAAKVEQFRKDLQADIQRITGSDAPLFCILSQMDCMAIAKTEYYPENYDCPQLRVPLDELALLRTDSMFLSGLPKYPFEVVREYVHIDAASQQALGRSEAEALILLMQGERRKPLAPTAATVSGDTVILSFDRQIIADTLTVNPVPNLGFSVICPENSNILRQTIVDCATVKLVCHSNPTNCKVRYAVNGERMKSGRRNGPRGNIRDKDGNWCFIFEKTLQ